MRIELIPDVPGSSGTKRRVVVASHVARSRAPDGSSDRSAMRQGEDLYHELLEGLYDAALIAQMNGEICDVNVRAVEKLGFSQETLCGLSVLEIIAGTDAALLATLAKNLENEQFTLIEAYCLRSDGSFFPAEITVSRLRKGGDSLCFFLRDITIRKQQEEMLRTTYNAIQNSGNGIAVSDLSGMLEYVNPACARMWGFDNPSQLVGSDLRTLLADDTKTEAMFEQISGTSQEWLAEMRGQRSDGQVVDVQVAAALNRDSDGEPVGMVFSFTDISDRKRAEEAEREAERTRVMLESLGAACHHLGQPATVILANLGIIEKRIDPRGDQLVAGLVESSIEAAETLGKVLHKLNTVNEYKTTPYLEKPDGEDSVDNRILDI